MCNCAAHITDRVLPNVPIRQWVLSLPFELRRLAARDPSVLAACSRIFVEAIFEWMRRTTALAEGRGGALTFVQRFGSSMNLHVHYHVLVADGLFTRTSADALPVFHEASSPALLDLQDVVRKVRNRIVAWLRRNGHASHDEADRPAVDPSALDGCIDEALKRGLFAEIASSSATARDARDDEVEHTTHRKSASVDGFNIHAAVSVGADDDVARERLIRYCARPAFALERLSVLPDGRIAYATKNPRRGASHRILTPIELIARIAALIPPPYRPFLRYHGVFAPASKWRKHIVPRPIGPVQKHECATKPAVLSPADAKAIDESSPPPAKTRHTNANISPPLWQRERVDAPVADDTDPRALTQAHRSRLLDGALLATGPRLDWAKLLRRTYLVDVLQCPSCGGATRIIAAITDAPVIRTILDHLRIPHARAPPSGAREPEYGDLGDEAWLDFANGDPVDEVDVGEVDGVDDHEAV